jgi:hypothetical protein
MEENQIHPSHDWLSRVSFGYQNSSNSGRTKTKRKYHRLIDTTDDQCRPGDQSRTLKTERNHYDDEDEEHQLFDTNDNEKRDFMRQKTTSNKNGCPQMQLSTVEGILLKIGPPKRILIHKSILLACVSIHACK